MGHPRGELGSVESFVASPDEKEKEIPLPTSDEFRPPSVRSRDDVHAPEAALPEDDEDEPELSMSKARCIALVATVTGAAFLNVRPPSRIH